jgi:hypothetical protein
MEIVEKFPVTSSILIFLSGAFGALIWNYIIISNKLSYISGQLDELLKFNKGLGDIIERSAKIDSALETIDGMHSRVKFLEQRLLNGGVYERSS